MKTLRTDCLVIGAGLAGSAYALEAAKRGLAVELLSLSEPLAANSDWAQGGIIYDTTTATDAKEFHYASAIDCKCVVTCGSKCQVLVVSARNIYRNRIAYR